MSESKTYTAAEVEALLAAERAKRNKSVNKEISCVKATKLSKEGNIPYTGVFVSGGFRQVYLPLAAAEWIVANADKFKGVVSGPTKDDTKALGSASAPRLAPAKS